MLFFIGFEVGGFQLVLRIVSTEFSMTATGSGLLVAAQSIGAVIMPLLFGSISDRIGKKRVLLIFSAFFLVGCVVAALAGSIFIFVLGVFLIGAGYSVCECTGSAALADAYPEKSAQYINLSQCMFSLGAVASPILIRYCMTGFLWSWRSVFFICSSAYILLIFTLSRAQFGNELTHSLPKTRAPLSTFWRNSFFLLLLLSLFLYSGPESGIGYFAETLFSKKLGEEALGAYAISIYWAMMALSRFVFGLVRLSSRHALPLIFGLSAILLSFLSISYMPMLSLIAYGFIGFVFGPVWSLLMDFAAKQYPQKTGSAIGLMSAGGGLGGMAFPAVMGLLADQRDLRSAFLLLSLTASAAGVLSLVMTILRKQRPRRNA